MFLLGVSKINPLEYNLPFEIFAGANYDKEPDISLDVSCEVEGRIREYIQEKYGSENVKFEYGQTKIEIKIKNEIHKIYIIGTTAQTFTNKIEQAVRNNIPKLDLKDEKTLELLLHADKNEDNIIGIPEFNTKKMKEIIKCVKPKNLNDLICINALAHGTGTWEWNARSIIRKEKAKINEVISNREDIMNYLMNRGIERKTSAEITEFISKGRVPGYKCARDLYCDNLRKKENKAKWNEYVEILKKHSIPNWYINSCEEIEYLFSKGFCIYLITNAFKIAWYKIHMPEAFYKAYFEINKRINVDNYFDKAQIKRKIRRLEELEEDRKYEKEETENVPEELQKSEYKDKINDLKILLQMYEKGIKKETKREEDEYDLINSKAIGEYCREIKHKFNTEELAVLIYRSKKISIDEKIKKYQDLIDNYPDMEVIKRINCAHYDSVKDMIKNEIKRLKDLKVKLLKKEPDCIYTYSEYNKSTKKWDTWQVFEHIRKTYKEVKKDITEYIRKYNDTIAYQIEKNCLNEKRIITAEYQVVNRRQILVNIYENNGPYLDIDNIFLNIPTPFKEGDLLVSCTDSPFRNGITCQNDNIFVLDWLCTWRKGIEELLRRGNYDSSDMMGYGYYLYEEGSNEFVRDHVWEYDSFEFYEGELKGINRTLKALSSLIKKKISIELFIHAYEEFKVENRRSLIDWYTEEGLKLAGCTNKDIKRYREKF